MPRFQRARATRDLLPDDTAARNHVREQFARVVESYGFQAIETPTFEKVELFSARSGPEIKSSMLTFHLDHEELALRPEMTAPVCRLMASGSLGEGGGTQKLYYVAPCFRYCRPRPDRYREFTQAGIECLGEAGPAADAEVIAAACRFLRAIGVQGYRLRIGSIGIFGDLLPAALDADDRAVVIGHLDRLMSIREQAAAAQASDGAARAALIDELKTDRIDLAAIQSETDYSGPESIEARATAGEQELVKRIAGEAEATYRRLWEVQDLVSGDVADRLIGVSRLKGPLADVDQQARALLAGTGATESLDRLLAVCRHVEMYAIDQFEVVLGIARGFTFYTSTVFEISSNGDQRSEKYCGGGRYDRLVEEFGGPAMPSCGCAFRFDGLVDAVRSGAAWSPPRSFEVYLVAESEQELPAAVGLAEGLRGLGVRAGVGVGPQDQPSSEDLESRRCERIALVSAKSARQGLVRVSDGVSVREVELDADALAKALQSTHTGLRAAS